MLVALAVLAGILAFAVACAVLSAFDRNRRARFQRQYPPIDDEAFLARCPPDVDRHVALKVRRILADQTGIPHDCIYPDQRLDELGD